MVSFRRAPRALSAIGDETDPIAAFAAFRASAQGLLDGVYPTGRLEIAAEAFAPAARAALILSEPDAETARRFFKERFTPLAILPENAASDHPGFVTGYYEPVLNASPVRTGRFRVPLYRPPADLVKIDDVSRPPGMDPSFRFARRLKSGLLDEYFDRAAIESGALAGRGLEIAWLEDPVDAFFIHVQGSARLRFPDGDEVRVGYAAKSGHPFTAIGRLLVEAGELTVAQADMDGIRDWLARHPERRDGLLRQNRSFIFFERSEMIDPGKGPVGAAKVPLTALASIAVDRELGTYGVPYLVDAPDLEFSGRPFRRLMVAQDTGSAIIGPARADIFVGSGPEAGSLAGRVRHPAAMHVLVPPALADRLVR